MMDKQEFLERFKDIIDKTWELFNEKNEQYATNDPLANFRKGSLLKFGCDDYCHMYSVLKDYMNKHVAHIYNNNIDGNKIRESLGDIAVYSIIGMVMLDAHKQEKEFPAWRNLIIGEFKPKD